MVKLNQSISFNSIDTKFSVQISTQILRNILFKDQRYSATKLITIIIIIYCLLIWLSLVKEVIINGRYGSRVKGWKREKYSTDTMDLFLKIIGIKIWRKRVAIILDSSKLEDIFNTISMRDAICESVTFFGWGFRHIRPVFSIAYGPALPQKQVYAISLLSLLFVCGRRPQYLWSESTLNFQ